MRDHDARGDGTVRWGAGWMALLGVAAGVGGAGLKPSGRVQAASEVTWRGQIAPILYRNCTSCHHRGGSGPFALTEYAEAKRFASVIDTATGTRYMPPWLPEPGHGDFADSRRLSAEEIALLHAWVGAGAPEGEGPVPMAPQYAGEWQLGPPDLVLETAGAISIPADGSDKFVNVILRNPLKETRWVRAMEIKPGSPRVVHHANVILDRTASLRRTHADWREGIPGMDIEIDSGDAFDPDSHFLFWKPDSTALVEPAGMPWRLDPGNDLVLNLHLKPTGRAETTTARIGLYFAKDAATKHPILLQLQHDAALNIPAGDAGFVVEDSLKLPVAVEVLGVYPHAHYLARRMEAWATLPGGGRRDLILIREWDIDRQGVYRLAAPLALPAGTTLHMRYVYDNSSANVHNPHTPPVRVHAGNRSEDEMAHFWVQVLPEPAAGMTDEQAQQKLEGAWMTATLEKEPDDPIALYNLAALDLAGGDASGASKLYERLLERTPADPRALTALGVALETAGDEAGAEARWRAALKADPEYYDAGFDLASLDLRTSNLTEAESLLRRAVLAKPEDAEAHRLLAQTLASEGKSSEALAQLERWRGLASGDPEPYRALAALLAETGESGRAVEREREVVRLAPGSATDWNDLGVYEVRAGDRAGAARDFARALALDPGLKAAEENLGRLKRMQQ